MPTQRCELRQARTTDGAAAQALLELRDIGTVVDGCVNRSGRDVHARTDRCHIVEHDVAGARQRLAQFADWLLGIVDQQNTHWRQRGVDVDVDVDVDVA